VEISTEVVFGSLRRKGLELAQRNNLVDDGMSL
jgi:hypothetical protein